MKSFSDSIKSVLEQVKTFLESFLNFSSDNRHLGASRPGCVRSAPRHERCGKSLEPGFSRWGKNNKSDFFKNVFFNCAVFWEFVCLLYSTHDRVMRQGNWLDWELVVLVVHIVLVVLRP